MASPKLTIPEIVENHKPSWDSCSPQQRSFLVGYISGGIANGKYDAVAAVHIAYPKVDASTAWASRLLQNRHVKKIIALHLGQSETEVVLSDIRALVKRSKRKGAHLDILVAPWLRAVAALEALVAQEKADV